VTTPDWQRIKSIFNGAVNLTSLQRAAYLEQACAGDLPLRGEVESLLSAHDNAEV